MLKGAPTVALLTRQITHYHHPRFVAAARILPRLDVISVANEGKFSEVIAQNVPDGYKAHRIFDTLQEYRKSVKQRTLVGRINELLDRLSPDVVAISGWASPESYAALGWARRRARGVVVMSDSRANDAPRNPMRDWVKARVVRACDAGLAAGKAHEDYLCELGLPRANVRLGYDVVDNRYFCEGAQSARVEDANLRRALSLPKRYILASARFIPKKNLIALIRAYKQASATLANPADLLIVGEGADRPALENLVGSLKRGKVHLPGLFAYEDLPALYALSDGFVHVPTTEQWGLVVNEAAASGLPLVLSEQCGAAQELLEHGNNGWQVCANDPTDMASALSALMSCDAEQRLHMGRASQEIVSHWGPDRFANGLKDAANLARSSQKSLSIFDRLIIKMMSRWVIETVV